MLPCTCLPGRGDSKEGGDAEPWASPYCSALTGLPGARVGWPALPMESLWGRPGWWVDGTGASQDDTDGWEVRGGLGQALFCSAAQEAAGPAGGLVGTEGLG